MLHTVRAKKDKNPGPGAYRSPSDFGQYDGNVYSSSGGMAYLTAGSAGKPNQWDQSVIGNNNMFDILFIIVI